MCPFNLENLPVEIPMPTIAEISERFENFTWELIYANVDLVETTIDTLSGILATCYFNVDTESGTKSYVCWLSSCGQDEEVRRWVVLPSNPRAFSKHLVEIDPPEHIFSLEELKEILPKEAAEYHRRIRAIDLYKQIALSKRGGPGSHYFSQTHSAG
jgi:hypothetical protein